VSVTLWLYSTLGGTKQEFRPPGDPVTMYVCGVTPYDTTHLGHAFCYVSFDVLNRYLRSLGHRVKYIQNITDIDNDILRRAKELGEDWKELGDRNVAIHQKSLRDLNVLEPDHWARATEEMPMIVEITRTLEQRGHAYESGGNVYFSVKTDPDYGRLSGLNRGDMLPKLDETGDLVADPHKRDPLDFILWMAAKPGEPTWESPWGPGRPGWHIECSAMSMRYLGEQLDIHGGGGDLVYPHHESEIAQSECFTGRRPFARFWMHVGMLRMDGEKMSKSLGNMAFVGKLIEEGHSPQAIRLYLLSVHYRGILDYRLADLRSMQTVVDTLRTALSAAGGASGTPLESAAIVGRFRTAMDDDLDTPRAIAAARELADAIIAARADGRSIRDAQAALRDMVDVLGVVVEPG
jgi:L-cysteine:1D-myo-inositol 2-amino-2-deoxy-alpha-D-glucopyranoside ligase